METESSLRAGAPEDWTLFKHQDSWCLRAPSLQDLVEFQKTQGLTPIQIRPANLEDVYLKLTGEELSKND